MKHTLPADLYLVEATYEALTANTTAFIRFLAAWMSDVALSSCNNVAVYHITPCYITLTSTAAVCMIKIHYDIESYPGDDKFSTDVLHIGLHLAGDVQLVAVESDTLEIREQVRL